MHAGGPRADVESVGDLAVGAAGGEVGEHLELARGEAQRRGLRCRRRRRLLLELDPCARGEQLDLTRECRSAERHGRGGGRPQRLGGGGPAGAAGQQRLRLAPARVRGAVGRRQGVPERGGLPPPLRFRDVAEPRVLRARRRSHRNGGGQLRSGPERVEPREQLAGRLGGLRPPLTFPARPGALGDPRLRGDADPDERRAHPARRHPRAPGRSAPLPARRRSGP